MIIKLEEYNVRNVSYVIRPAEERDAKELSELRVQIDGETENLDRVAGEGYIDESGFRELIKSDTELTRNLFLVAEVEGRLVGFSRCAGNQLKRTAHQVEFGVCVLKEYWGYGIGQNLLKGAIDWADSTGVKKISLKVLETNGKAIELYNKYGFEVEGVLRNDKLLSDGNYYSTILMGRVRDV